MTVVLLHPMGRFKVSQSILVPPLEGALSRSSEGHMGSHCSFVMDPVNPGL